MSDVTDKKENVGQEVAGDFFKDLRSAIFQKVGTPLYISIITIFYIDNWDKLLFLAFSKISIESRIYVLNHETPFTYRPCVAYGVLFTVLMPYLTRLIELSQYFSNLWKSNISSWSDVASFRNIDKTNRLKHRIDIRDEKRNKRKVEYTDKCNKLIADIKSLEKKHGNLKSDWDSLKGIYDLYSSALTSSTIDLKTANENLSNVKKELDELSNFISEMLALEKISNNQLSEIKDKVITRINGINLIVIKNSSDEFFNRIFIRDEDVKHLDKKMKETLSNIESRDNPKY
ncbi:hypothetical protein ACNPG5_03405 [Citrobacter cronae]|uniref:hypothetical protein n=1 Tax=Citrobacter cronae TaxID=1748967 RepID=UPI003AA7B967